jgi:hypothetical protein
MPLPLTCSFVNLPPFAFLVHWLNPAIPSLTHYAVSCIMLTVLCIMLHNDPDLRIRYCLTTQRGHLVLVPAPVYSHTIANPSRLPSHL